MEGADVHYVLPWCEIGIFVRADNMAGGGYRWSNVLHDTTRKWHDTNRYDTTRHYNLVILCRHGIKCTTLCCADTICKVTWPVYSCRIKLDVDGVERARGQGSIWI